MQVVHPVCCGIDVHAKMLVACLLLANGEKKKRTFSTMTAALLQLRDWLVAAQCTHVAIESTGVYWKPVFNILEDALTVILINPEHAHALRGRKTDVKDAEWLADLLRHGLLRPSFIPPPVIRELRELTRYRESVVREQSAVANRIQKLLESGNIKLGQVASDTLGVSGRLILKALAKGESDPRKLAALARGKLKEKSLSLEQALHGRLTVNQRFVLGELLSRWEQLEAADARVSSEIDKYVQANPKLARARELLDSIPGIGPRVAEVITAEIGIEMAAVFADAAHLASWAGMCPGNKATGGKRLSGRTRKGNTYLRSALVQAAWGASLKKHCYFVAQPCGYARTNRVFAQAPRKQEVLTTETQSHRENQTRNEPAWTPEAPGKICLWNSWCAWRFWWSWASEVLCASVSLWLTLWSYSLSSS